MQDPIHNDRIRFLKEPDAPVADSEPPGLARGRQFPHVALSRRGEPFDGLDDTPGDIEVQPSEVPAGRLGPDDRHTPNSRLMASWETTSPR